MDVQYSPLTWGLALHSFSYPGSTAVPKYDRERDRGKEATFI